MGVRIEKIVKEETAKRGAMETFSEKFFKKPLAVFVSWGIFLSVDGNEPNDADRRFAFERKS